MTKFSGVFFHETAKIRDNKYIIANNLGNDIPVVTPYLNFLPMPCEKSQNASAK